MFDAAVNVVSDVVPGVGGVVLVGVGPWIAEVPVWWTD